MDVLTRKQRVLGALRREAVDRLPAQSNYTPAMGVKLAAHFQIPIEELPERLDNHLVRVDLQHDRRRSDDGRTTYDWWGTGWSTETEGYWHTVVRRGAANRSAAGRGVLRGSEPGPVPVREGLVAARL
jgi:hypothetical protein